MSRKERKQKRNAGLAYVTGSGKLIEERRLTRLGPCKKNCQYHVSHEDQQRIFASYYREGNYSHRWNFVASNVVLVPKKRCVGKKKKLRKFSVEYHLKTESHDVCVCKGCFMKTLGETGAFIKSVVDNLFDSKNDLGIKDGRGKSIPTNKSDPQKLQAIQDHIKSFPTNESHYSRSHSSKQYLPQGLNVAMMYRMYVVITEEPLSIKIYRQVFKKIGLKVKSPQVDLCNRCSEFQCSLKHEKNETTKAAIEEQKRIHQEDAEAAYEAKRRDKAAVIASNGTKELLTGDLQKVLATPLLSAGMSYYKRTLSTLNFTVHGTLFNTKCYMWDETIARRGANEIASCLYIHLQKLSPKVQHVTLYTDNCPGQNRNKIVAGMLAALIHNHPTIKIFDHKFLVPGHTHMECDSDHALIEKAKKAFGTEIHHPSDWYKLVRQVKIQRPMEVIEMTSRDFFDFEDLFNGTFTMREKNTEGNKFVWKDVKWIRYNKNQGSFLYKTTLCADAPFEEMNLKKKGKPIFNLGNKIKVLNKNSLPISDDKKKDLLALLPFLRPDVRQFYEMIPSECDAKNYDYDIIETDEDPEDRLENFIPNQDVVDNPIEPDQNNNATEICEVTSEEYSGGNHKKNQEEVVVVEDLGKRSKRVIKKKTNQDYVYYN